jgi:formate dehydrogenase
MSSKDSSGGDMSKWVAVLPEGGEAAKNRDYLCCVENALDLKEFAQEKKADLFVTADKEGPDSEFEKHLPDAEVVITTPFHPGKMTRERIEKAKKLKLILTAGIGSDHIDLQAAADHGLTVAEVTGSNVVSVAEDELMRMLLLIRNFLPAWKQIQDGVWDVPKTAVESYDLESKTIGTVGGGHIGYEVMKRLKNFNVKLLYYGRHRKEKLDELGVEFHNDLDTFLGQLDICTINIPLSDKTRGMFNAEVIGKLKKGAYLINNARGAIVDAQAVVDAVKSGQLKGYSGDVWDPQPPPEDHPWWKMPKNAMTAHTSGTTLDAQRRYRDGVLHMLDCFLQDKDFEEDFYIVKGGKLADQYS